MKHRFSARLSSGFATTTACLLFTTVLGCQPSSWYEWGGGEMTVTVQSDVLSGTFVANGADAECLEDSSCLEPSLWRSANEQNEPDLDNWGVSGTLEIASNEHQIDCFEEAPLALFAAVGFYHDHHDVFMTLLDPTEDDPDGSNNSGQQDEVRTTFLNVEGDIMPPALEGGKSWTLGLSGINCEVDTDVEVTVEWSFDESVHAGPEEHGF